MRSARSALPPLAGCYFPSVGKTALPYTPALDGLRAIGITLVLVAHGAKPREWPGGFGVDVFFVLSGFLITTLLWRDLEERGGIAFRTFYLRRAIRLFPALLTVLIVTLLVGGLLSGQFRRLVGETASAALYLTPLTDALVGPPLFYGHLWTLAMEEYFYLVWPVALVACVRVGLRWRAIVALLLTAAVLLYAVRGAATFALGNELHPPRVAGIAIGCALSLLLFHKKAQINASMVAAIGILALVAAWFLTRAVDALTPIAAALGAVALIIAVMDEKRTLVKRALELSPVVYLGKISYEMYLWHVPFLLGAAMATGLERNEVWWWAYPCALLAAACTHQAFVPLQARWRSALSRSDRLRSTSAAGSGGRRV